MSLTADLGSESPSVTVRPPYGRPVTFVVARRTVNVSKSTSYWATRREERWVVSLKGSTGDGFSTHTNFERALSAMVSRARRYEKAYSEPRGISRQEVAA